MKRYSVRKTMLAVAAAAIALPGCTNYVKLDDYNATISEIHATDQKLQSQIDTLSQKYDTLATEVAGRIEVKSAAHFATGDATLNEQDKPFLTDFAKVVGTRHPEALVTVEGFADPQGSTAMNRRLGLARAQAVSEFLASNGMSASQLRTISYGESTDRQVRPGKIGPDGADNRRVALAVDYAGATTASAAPASMPEQPMTAPESSPPTDQPASPPATDQPAPPPDPEPADQPSPPTGES
jgi:peptidoglycan-associated lipoprotein